jgi:hypothetical protein
MRSLTKTLEMKLMASLVLLDTRFNLSRERAEANLRDPNFQPERITLGLPRSAHRGELKSFLDGMDIDNKRKMEAQ